MGVLLSRCGGLLSVISGLFGVIVKLRIIRVGVGLQLR